MKAYVNTREQVIKILDSVLKVTMLDEEPSRYAEGCIAGYEYAITLLKERLDGTD